MHANARIGSMMYVWCMPSSIILQYVRCKWSDDQFSGRLVLDRDMILRFAGSMMGFMHVWHSKPFKATLSILTPQNYGYFGSPPNTTAGHTGSNKPWPIGPGPIWSLWKMLFWGCQNWDPKKKKKTPCRNSQYVQRQPAGRTASFRFGLRTRSNATGNPKRSTKTLQLSIYGGWAKTECGRETWWIWEARNMSYTMRDNEWLKPEKGPSWKRKSIYKPTNFSGSIVRCV